MNVGNNIFSCFNVQPQQQVTVKPETESKKETVSFLAKRCQVLVNRSAYSAINTEPFEKVAKNSSRFLDICKELGEYFTCFEGASEAHWRTLASRFKSAGEFCESLRFFAAFETLFIPKVDKNTGKSKLFWFDDKNSWQKRLDRSFLFAHTCGKMGRGLDKYKLIDLAWTAKFTIGSNLPWTLVITDGFYQLSSVFSGWDSVNKFCDKKLSEETAETKVAKWKHRPDQIAHLRESNPKTVAELEKYYKDRTAAATSAIDNQKQQIAKDQQIIDSNAQKFFPLNKMDWTRNTILGNAQARIKTAEKTIKKLEGRIEKFDTRLVKLDAHEYQALADSLAGKEVEKKIESKIKKWEAIIHFRNSEKWMSVVSFINSALKIGVIGAAFFFTAMNWWSTPVLIFILSWGFLADSLGLTKIMMKAWQDDYKKDERNPKITEPLIEGARY